MIVKAEVYECPNGHYEKTKDRAVAWHLHSALKSDDGMETASFSDCLQIIRKRDRVIALLKELDNA